MKGIKYYINEVFKRDEHMENVVKLLRKLLPNNFSVGVGDSAETTESYYITIRDSKKNQPYHVRVSNHPANPFRKNPSLYEAEPSFMKDENYYYTTKQILNYLGISVNKPDFSLIGNFKKGEEVLYFIDGKYDEYKIKTINYDNDSIVFENGIETTFNYSNINTIFKLKPSSAERKIMDRKIENYKIRQKQKQTELRNKEEKEQLENASIDTLQEIKDNNFFVGKEIFNLIKLEDGYKAGMVSKKGYVDKINKEYQKFVAVFIFKNNLQIEKL